MQWSQWLQGGPFLEVSFLLELKKKKKETIQEIIFNLSKVRNRIEIYDKNVEEIIDFFDRGYPFDEKDPQSIYMHSLRLRLYVYLSRKRKATLQIELVSSNAIIVNFWFYGSNFDAMEWDQIGIENEEITDFTNFLKELYFVYEFKIGGMAIEEDVISLFGFDEAYPNECYRYENISPDRFLQDTYGFIDIIWNEKYNKLSQVSYNHKRLDKDGILINISSFQE
ncbi:hypothetical protein [Bacillus sp. AFS096315]|uniref:hypothetical protein n=1 Tax=Bacillus sp. AFS096315 TaxID=2033517 RepID=UPI000BED34C7|nr:hypothetical protein [Bacillus sp. AFS096315]PEC48163.1 hypothetical protein CON00_17755 [Bacillus sp. AFS096315]